MEQNEKNKELREKLLYNRRSGAVDADTLSRADDFCEGYKNFLNAAKTEREAVTEAVRLAADAGFTEFERGKRYNPGDRVYLNNRGKALLLAVIGRRPVCEGTAIAAAHIDSPRLDLKPSPLYESDGLAMFKTRYYGGIKKYQWTAVPMSLHGVVCRKDGSKVTVCVGEDEGDPQFCVTELLIHLSGDQMKKNGSEIIAGEKLNLLIGSRPMPGDDGADSVKLNILRLLNEKYGITEEDFFSAELEAVPAAKARDIGFDRSMIGAYGQDDRVCAYPALRAVLEAGTPELTAITCLADKEEIGSDGNTGLTSCYLKNFICDLAEAQGGSGRDALSASRCLSADVNAAYDPSYADAYDKRNSCLLGAGTVLTKYSGGRGKGGASDASAEFMAWCRGLFDSKGVLWQAGELGKVDGGGGGTVSKYVASLDIDVVDLGVGVLSMHAPMEVVSKLDVYMTYRAVAAFFE